jgi:hypothetical protein
VVRIKTGVEPHTLFQLRQSLLQFAEMRVLPRQQKEGRPAIGNLGQHIFDRENLSSPPQAGPNLPPNLAAKRSGSTVAQRTGSVR